MGLIGMSLGAALRRPAGRADAARDVRQAARRVAARDHAVPRDDQLRAELRLRPVRPAGQDRDVDGLDLSSWRVAGCGAEPVNAQTLAAFAEKFGRAGFRASSFLPSYGLAEHVLAATLAARHREPRVDTVSADALSARRVASPARLSGRRGDPPSSAADVHFPAMRCASFGRTARTRAIAKSGRSRWRAPL